MQQSEERQYYIECLRHDIENVVGRPIVTPSDFNYLYLEIQKALNEAPSISTLKRLWAYVTNTSSRSISTLNTLSRFIGYSDWRGYVEQLMRHNRVESDFITTNTILSSNLHLGDHIELTWHPGRRLLAEYIGENNFVIREVESSKLLPGTQFSAMIFSKGMPLIISDVERDGIKLGNYSAGDKTGITSLRFIPSPK